jgi:hypothetical protein
LKEPLAQVPLQALATHAEPTTFVPEHAVKHAPQWPTLLVRSVSQPFVCSLPSQSPNPGAHDPLHTPPAHVRVDTFALEHAIAHAPQLSGSVAMFCSHPSLARPLQSAHPALHA